MQRCVHSWLSGFLGPGVMLIAVLSAGRAAMAEGAALALPERAIQSLAAGPELLGARTGDETPGAVTLFLELRFLNDCLADAGPNVLVAYNGSGTGYAILTQRTDPTGCPDMFQPTSRSLALKVPTLPGNKGGIRLMVVAKSSSGRPLTTPTRSAGSNGESLATARLLGGSGRLADFSFGSIEPHASGAGYTLRGKLGLAPDCAPAAVQSFLFEIPDSSGEPRHDVIALIIPAHCGAAQPDEPFELRIDTPQRNAGRRVQVLNGDQPVVRL